MPASTENLINDQGIKRANAVRYFQLFLLVLAAGAIYPLLYLRQNFEITILSTFNITVQDLSDYYSTLGVIYLLCYVPSGWLADKFSPRKLITFSLALNGCLGLWFAAIPGKDVLPWIFAGWGISAGLTFWASLIKGVNLLALEHEKGRFFGVLDGGRGLVEAMLATIAIGIFSIAVSSGEKTDAQALTYVIYLYSFICLLLSLVVFIFISNDGS